MKMNDNGQITLTECYLFHHVQHLTHYLRINNTKLHQQAEKIW